MTQFTNICFSPKGLLSKNAVKIAIVLASLLFLWGTLSSTLNVSIYAILKVVFTILFVSFFPGWLFYYKYLRTELSALDGFLFSFIMGTVFSTYLYCVLNMLHMGFLFTPFCVFCLFYSFLIFFQNKNRLNQYPTRSEELYGISKFIYEKLEKIDWIYFALSLISLAILSKSLFYLKVNELGDHLLFSHWDDFVFAVQTQELVRAFPPVNNPSLSGEPFPFSHLFCQLYTAIVASFAQIELKEVFFIYIRLYYSFLFLFTLKIFFNNFSSNRLLSHIGLLVFFVFPAIVGGDYGSIRVDFTVPQYIFQVTLILYIFLLLFYCNKFHNNLYILFVFFTSANIFLYSAQLFLVFTPALFLFSIIRIFFYKERSYLKYFPVFIVSLTPLASLIFFRSVNFASGRSFENINWLGRLNAHLNTVNISYWDSLNAFISSFPKIIQFTLLETLYVLKTYDIWLILFIFFLIKTTIRKEGTPPSFQLLVIYFFSFLVSIFIFPSSHVDRLYGRNYFIVIAFALCFLSPYLNKFQSLSKNISFITHTIIALLFLWGFNNSSIENRKENAIFLKSEVDACDFIRNHTDKNATLMHNLYEYLYEPVMLELFSNRPGFMSVGGRKNSGNYNSRARFDRILDFLKLNTTSKWEDAKYIFKKYNINYFVEYTNIKKYMHTQYFGDRYLQPFLLKFDKMKVMEPIFKNHDITVHKVYN